jgi:hypothetical protein
MSKTLGFLIVLLLALSALAAYEGGAYECHTDKECEIEEARQCIFLCQ